ncbi:MAG: NAD(P)H-dependent oxidoreductase [Bacteroidota bacterium]
MNICIISGSARANNNTIRVGYALERLLKNEHIVTLIDFQQYDIPLINQAEVSLNNLSAFQKKLVDGMSNAQIVFLISPEYNYTTTPEILNMLHRMGDRNFKQLFDEKIFALVGVSTGKGGKIPSLHLTTILNKVISYLDLNSFVSSKFFESHFTKQVLDENGNSLENKEYDNGINDFVSYTLRMAARWGK